MPARDMFGEKKINHEPVVGNRAILVTTKQTVSNDARIQRERQYEDFY